MTESKEWMKKFKEAVNVGASTDYNDDAAIEFISQLLLEVIEEIETAGKNYDMSEETDASEPMFKKIQELKKRYVQ